MKDEKVGAVLVIGGGIAGIQSSLDLAESGFRVYLLDKGPSIGGVMSQLDKTFPTNDCSMCILSPKLVDVGRHPNIELITKAELESVEGGGGNFKVLIRKNPRYVDEDKCTGCGECTEVCPVEVDNEYEENLVKRKAIYRPFAQAIPNVFSIDKENRAPCGLTCPAGCNVQAYVALISKGKFEEAYKTIKEKIPFPSICGRVCHHPCEDKCNRADIEEPIAIASLKRFVADYVGKKGIKRDIKEVEKKEEKIAIIGAGPAGLTAAQDLVKFGYNVTVFEAMSKAGGMMRAGIPEYRLPRSELESDICQILEQVGLRTNSPINSMKDLKGLKEKGYKAIFLAVGAQKSRRLNIEGVDLDGVLHGIEFLRDINLKNKVKIDKKVVVIGGGNVAIDVAMSSLRSGAEEVHLACLESREEMPAHEWEIEDAVEEGIKIHCSKGPKRILGKDGRVKGIELITCKSVFDENGRFNPKFVEGSESTLDADTVIIAIGQTSDLSFLDGEEIKITKAGTIEVDPITLATTVQGIFAGGDVVRGPASVVEAIAHGHEAAISIDRYIREEDLKEGRERIEEKAAEAPDREIPLKKRVIAPKLPVEKRRNNFNEISLGFTEEMAIEEANRCLNCGICSECLQCVEKCEADAIKHDMREEFIKLGVGSIILALGFDEFDPKLKPEYGYGRFRNVITSIEFERIQSASGPSQGSIVRLSDGKHPKKIAFIQCVGSRDKKTNPYCSSVCCMYATKEAIIAKEHDSDIECTIFFMDMRTFGKEFDQYYERAKEEHGIRYIRSRAPCVEELPDGNLRVTYEKNGKLIDEKFDLVVLSVGLNPPEDAKKISEKLGIRLNEHGFCLTDEFLPLETNREGIYVCGAFEGPKDIPETVIQASGAASMAGSLLSSVRGTLVKEKKFPPERDVSGEEPRIGVFVCNCGINIGGVVDVPKVVEYARRLPQVVYAEENLYTCSQDTQERIKEKIEEHNLNRVVVASCTPRTHEVLFQNTIREAGLNPYLFELTNIRDQCSWVHRNEPEKATEKANDLVRMAVAKSGLLMPLKKGMVDMDPSTLVIGGGVSGITTALELADKGFEVDLIERENELGGNLRNIHYLLDGGNPREYLKEIVRKVEENKKINVFTQSKVVSVEGYVGNFSIKIEKNGKEKELKNGVIIVATGAREYKPDEYLYGEDERIVTQLELEEKIANDNLKAKNVVMIQCVGSREEERPYCSRICCSDAIKNAIKIKEKHPDTNVFILYRDMRTYGFNEIHYNRARDLGVLFIRYDKEEKPEVSLDGRELRVIVKDQILDKKFLIKPDILALSVATIPQKDNEELSKMLKVPLSKDNFFLEAHMKLRPVDFATDGIFLCGMAHSPKSLGESIAQAYAAASRAATLLSKEKLETEPITAFVDETLCRGCGRCEELCEFDAIKLEEVEGRLVSHVNEILCKGCGICSVECPSGAITMRHFTSKQISRMIEVALGENGIKI